MAGWITPNLAEALPDGLLALKRAVPSYCYYPGNPFQRIPNLHRLFLGISLPDNSRQARIAVEAIKWYWSMLEWPSHPTPQNRGVSWLELTLDFIAATDMKFIGQGNNNATTVDKAKLAFSKISKFLYGKLEVDLYPCSEGRITSLGPFGVRNAVEGLKVAPRLLRPAEWLPLVREVTLGAPVPYSVLMQLPLSRTRSPFPRPYRPLLEGFRRTFPSLPRPI